MEADTTLPIFNNIVPGEIYETAFGMVCMRIGRNIYDTRDPNDFLDIEIPSYDSEANPEYLNAVVLVADEQHPYVLGEAFYQEPDSYARKYSFDFLGGSDMEDK